MHIPDGVLSPSTCALAGAVMLPAWGVATRRVQERLQTRQVPLLALGAAFCFTVMMFNIPALGGTTAHPVAGTLLAILLGPWAALIGITVALAIQALFFADGGLLAFGANCFSMAFVLPFVGYSVYRLIVRRAPVNSPLLSLAAGIGAFVGINAAAAMVALLLGLQPLLFHEPNGHALYFPFGPAVTFKAMLGAHLLVAGPAEAIVTALVVRFLLASHVPLYGYASPDNSPYAAGGHRRETLWVGLLALAALTPLGLLAKGDAWGEWDKQGLAEQIKRVEGEEYVPKGVEQADRTAYKGIKGLQDYASDDGKNKLGYAGSAILGVSTISVLLLFGGRALAGKQGNDLTQRRRGAEREGEAHTEAQRHREGTEGTGNRKQGTESGPIPESLSPIPASLPDWLQQPSDETGLESGSKRQTNKFVERTLGELGGAAAATLTGERWARQAGYLQQIDPRAKLTGILGLIAATAFLRHVESLLILFALGLALGMASRLPLRLLLGRVWLSVPLYVGLIALPAALNVVTPGPALLMLWRHPLLTVTAPGLALALTLMLRVGVAVTFATLLTLTTPWHDVLRALRACAVPRLFVSVLAMTYRYILVLLQTAGEMYLARRSRAVGRASNRSGRQYVGSSMAALFGKTLTLSEEVHAAMLSRGFRGEMPTLSRFQWRSGDRAWFAALLLIVLLLWWHEYV